MFVHSILCLPHSTPKPSLRAVCGLLGIKWRIWTKKIMLILAIRGLEEGDLAREVFEVQLQMDWPGLAREVTHICQEVGLPDVCRVAVTKREVKEAIK